MVKNKKWILITWQLTLVFIICAFLPMLKFSFNSSAVNIFGVCEEFAATYQKYHRDFAPVGYGAFAVMVLAALSQVWYLIAAVKDAVKAKGAKKLSVAMTIVSIVALAGYLFLTFRHCSYTLTVVPFIFAAAGIAFIALSGKTKL